MPSHLYLHTACVASLTLASALSPGQPPEHSLGAFLAANATEFRWNLSLLALVGLAQLAAAGFSCGIKGAARVLFLAPALWAGTGFAECTVAQTSADGGGLWGAPLHLCLAGILPACLCLYGSHTPARRAQPRPALISGAGAVGLGGLGLLWNFAQTSLQEGWAWDWIESGPCWIALSLAGGTHLWARVGVAFSALYLAFLSLSRTALITSAHHLQSPSNPCGIDSQQSQEALATGLGASPGLVGVGATLLGFGILAVRVARGGSWPRATPLPPAVLPGHFSLALPPLASAAGAGALSFAAVRIAAQTPALRALHWSFVLFFTAGLRLAWHGAGGLIPLSGPLGLTVDSAAGLLPLVPGALLIGAGWLHLTGAARRGMHACPAV